MNRTVSKSFVEDIVVRSLLEELYTTPKPGLVDLNDNGSHNDMNISLFKKSAKSIAPYISEIYDVSSKWDGSAEELFLIVRKIGVQAECAMFNATYGVNTHKGSIFTLGLIACALASVLKDVQNITTKSGLLLSVFDYCKKMTERTLLNELNHINKKNASTHGEKIFLQCNERGVRGQALAGFPIIRDVAFPFFMLCVENNVDANFRNVMTLLKSISVLNDTNVINRSSYEELGRLQKDAQSIILKMERLFNFSESDVPKWYASKENLSLIGLVESLNEKCIKKNISPGGSADILSACIFIHNFFLVLFDNNSLY